MFINVVRPCLNDPGDEMVLELAIAADARLSVGFGELGNMRMQLTICPI
jgi:hypothetical protein